MNITDEDICAKCHKCEFSLPASVVWNAMAVCTAGWPFKEVLMNIVSVCPEFTAKAHA